MMVEILPIATVLLLLLLILLSVVTFLRASRGVSSDRLESQIAEINEGMERLERVLREEFGRNREEAGVSGRQLREEVTGSVQTSGETIATRIAEIATLQSTQLETFSSQLTNLTDSLGQRLEAVRGTVEQRLKMLQDENSQKLEQMRETVDEKLHATLEQRLGESFKLVSDRLERVYQGLGEMQTLASGVGDLKKVLTNIKTSRGGASVWSTRSDCRGGRRVTGLLSGCRSMQSFPRKIFSGCWMRRRRPILRGLKKPGACWRTG
jgi:DNA recombination protein RmuC